MSPSWFSSCGGHKLRYLEILNFEDPSRNICNTGIIHESDVSKFVGQSGRASQAIFNDGEPENNTGWNAREGIRIIFSQAYGADMKHGSHEKIMVRPNLHMRESTYRSIFDAFDLPPAYLEMLDEGSTVFVDVDRFTHFMTRDNKRQPLRFMMQNNFTSSWAYSTAMCFSPERRLTSAFVHSLSDHETDDVINKITAHRDDIGRPGLLPSVLLAPRVHSANTKVRDCHSLIAHIEDHTGIFPNWHPNSDCCAKHRKDHKGQKRHFTIDFDQVTNDLTSVSHKLAYCEYVSEVHLPMFETILEIESRVDRFNMDAQPKDRTVEFFQPRETGEAASRLRIRNELLKGSLHDTTRRARYLSKRSQAQVQTIYSLVAQKDSLIAQKNNALSMRDSAAMKVISVITAAFLPATFTATLFSTTFFDFQPEKEGHIASAWLWLYFAVAIILTIIIFSWWYVSSRHVTKKIHKSLGRTEDGERTPLPNRWIGSLMADMYGVFTSPFRRKKAQGDAESSDSSGYDLDKHML